MDLRVTLGRLQLENPILVASGTFGYGREAMPFVDLRRLGGVIPKSVTWQPRPGNPPPRIVETASGMLNAIGLDNDGIDHFLAHHWPFLRDQGARVAVNIAGKSVDDFARLAARLAPHGDIVALELNLSCPNVAGGIDFAIDPQLTTTTVARVRAECSHPLLAKLTPNVTHIVPIAEAAHAGGADAVTLINTLLGTAIDWRRRRPMLANTFGGLSGPAIKPVALRMVLQVARATNIPIIAAGGISTLDDVMEFLVAGASAVQIGTANFFHPSCAMEILDGLPAALAELQANSITDVIGTLLKL